MSYVNRLINSTTNNTSHSKNINVEKLVLALGGVAQRIQSPVGFLV